MDEVTVNLKWSMGLRERPGGNTVWYGPGLTTMPARVAHRLGLKPVTEPTEPEETAVDNQPAADLTTISGIGPELARVMRERGINTIADLAEASMSDLIDIPGIARKTAAKLKAAALAKETTRHGE